MVPKLHPWLGTLAPNAQDGAVRIQDILALFVNNGRRWRRVILLYIQSMVHSMKVSKSTNMLSSGLKLFLF